MAIVPWRYCFPLFFLCLSFSSFRAVAAAAAAADVAEQRISEESAHQEYRSVPLSILLVSSDSTCIRSSSKADTEAASLQVAHRHGPCSKIQHKAENNYEDLPTHAKILQLDQARVDSIHSPLRPSFGVSDRLQRDNRNPARKRIGLKKDVELPARPGSLIGSANYYVSVGLGTPKKDLALIFDTGSDLTWTQCQPCIKSCYQQKDPVFDPSSSSTYSNVSCSSPLCSDLTGATGQKTSCSGSTCIYGVQYGDSSFSVGFFARDKLTLSPNSVVDSFLFGCGENNQGLFSGTAGLLGLGRQKLSVVSQTASKFGKYFSYCLPSGTSTGHLTFGSSGRTRALKNIQYTPLLSNPAVGDSFYFLGLQAISVGGHILPIATTVFHTSGTLIDSGTVITRLPPAAYTALRSAFRTLMSRYPTAPALSILDTCFDLTGYSTVAVPKVSLHFQGGATVDLAINGILYAVKASRVCVAFAGNSDATDVAILGNVQQQTLEVVYDVAGGMLGFGQGGCR